MTGLLDLATSRWVTLAGAMLVGAEIVSRSTDPLGCVVFLAALAGVVISAYRAGQRCDVRFLGLILAGMAVMLVTTAPPYTLRGVCLGLVVTLLATVGLGLVDHRAGRDRFAWRRRVELLPAPAREAER